MSHRRSAVAALALLWGCAACGSDTTSFRTTERSDPDRAGPPSAPYDVAMDGRLVARAHVWSSGGFMSSTDEPMTHIGFEIKSLTRQPLTFDADVLELVLFDKNGAALPAPRFTTMTPLGPSLIIVPPGDTTVLAAYYLLPVRPRAVDSMQVRWTLRMGNEEYRQVTGFLRDDDAPILERVPPAEHAPPAVPAPPAETTLPRV